MRVLIIGYGSMGRRHAANARALGHEVWVFDNDRGQISEAKTDGLSAIWWPVSPQELTFDAAIIATPAATHHEVVQCLYVQGYTGPLLVEKPLDVSLEHADFWRSWPHPTAMVGYNWRFYRPAHRIYVGHVMQALLVTLTNMEEWPGSGYASMLLECSHDIDLARWFLGDVDSVCGVHGMDSFRLCELQGPRGDRAFLYLVGSANDPLRLVSAITKQGMQDYSLDLRDKFDLNALETTYLREIIRFLEAAEAGTPVPNAATFEDGLAVIEIVEQAERLASAGVVT